MNLIRTSLLNTTSLVGLIDAGNITPDILGPTFDDTTVTFDNTNLTWDSF